MPFVIACTINIISVLLKEFSCGFILHGHDRTYLIIDFNMRICPAV